MTDSADQKGKVYTVVIAEAYKPTLDEGRIWGIDNLQKVVDAFSDYCRNGPRPLNGEYRKGNLTVPDRYYSIYVDNVSHKFVDIELVGELLIGKLILDGPRQDYLRSILESKAVEPIFHIRASVLTTRAAIVIQKVVTIDCLGSIPRGPQLNPEVSCLCGL